MKKKNENIDSRRLQRELAESIAKQAASSPTKIESKRPHEAAQAIELLAQGVSIVRIKEETGISLCALTRLRQDHSEVISHRQERAANDAARAADAFRMLLEEKADQLGQDAEALAKVNPKDLAITFGVCTDKALSLAGRASTIVEHRAGPTREEYREALRRAQGRLIEVGDEVIDDGGEQIA
ncbi:MAG: hypothetical protein O3A87_07550 [Verrucomicrobia bacterium]|nr:hypothetical protein [Verrucomicrobiota bacterium]